MTNDKKYTKKTTYRDPIEGAVIGRNAVRELIKSGRSIDKIFVRRGEREGSIKVITAEAKKLGIPVIGICDTNADPETVDLPVPGNDDAIRAIQFYAEMISASVLDGMQANIAAKGVKVEEMVEEKSEAPKAAKKRTSKKAAEKTEE